MSQLVDSDDALNAVCCQQGVCECVGFAPARGLCSLQVDGTLWTGGLSGQQDPRWAPGGAPAEAPSGAWRVAPCQLTLQEETLLFAGASC